MQLAFTLALLGNQLWFASFTGLVMAGMGIQGARLARRDYVFTYLILAGLVFVKNVGAWRAACAASAGPYCVPRSRRPPQQRGRA